MKKSSDTNSKVPNKTRPALTPEARENQLVSLSVDAAEKALINGTASSQVIVHFLRLGSIKTQLENEKLKRERTNYRTLQSKRICLQRQIANRIR